MLRLLFLVLLMTGCSGRLDFGVAPDAGTCTERTACPAPLQCELEQRVCVECLGDSDCAATARVCDVSSHRCVDCVSNAQCSVRELCEPTTHRCVPGCEYVENCPASYRFCNQGRCHKCDWDEHCPSPATPVCDLDVGLCVACAADRDCGGETPRCDRRSGACVACLSSRDCTEAAPYCDPGTQRCIRS